MKVTYQGRSRPLLTLNGLISGSAGGIGPGGQVPTSNGSNSVAWGSNIANIFSNSSNKLTGPDVNFISGSGIAFAAASNTLTISSIGAGGGGGQGGSLTQVPALVWVANASSGFMTPLVRCEGSGTLNAKVNVTVSGAVFVNLMKNGVRQQQLTASSTGLQTFTGISVVAGDQVYIAFSSGGSAFPTATADALSLSAGMIVIGSPVAGMAIA